MHLLCVLLALALSGCVLPQEPVEIPTPPPIPAPVPPPVVQDVPAEVTYISLPPPSPVVQEATTKPSGKSAKPAHVPTPQQLIQDAQKEARVAPTKRGYFGGRGIQRYLWSPGKIYDVYLTPGVATKLELPPGEVMAHALMLNPKSFDVATATVGSELTATSIILIRPCAQGDGDCVPSPDVDVALTSASGRSYDLHLIIGRVGMVGVTWELTLPVHLQVEEPGMLPRRQP